ELGPFGLWIVNANKPASSRSEPESAGVIQIYAGDRAGRYSVGCCEKGKPSIAISSYPVIEPNPNIAHAVFTERVGYVVLDTEARSTRHVAKGFSGALPKPQGLGGEPPRDPDVASRVRKETQELVVFYAILACVNRERARRLDLIESISGRKPVETRRSADPPFTIGSLQRDTFRPPA